MLLKGLAYQHDFQAFLEHPRTRMQYVRLQEEHAREWYYATAVGSGTAWPA